MAQQVRSTLDEYKCEMLKIILPEMRFNPGDIRLSIEKLRKIGWDSTQAYWVCQMMRDASYITHLAWLKSWSYLLSYGPWWLLRNNHSLHTTPAYPSPWGVPVMQWSPWTAAQQVGSSFPSFLSYWWYLASLWIWRSCVIDSLGEWK